MEAAFLSPISTSALPRSAPVGGSAAAGTTNGAAGARKAAQEFESVFLNTLLEGMFAGLKTDGPGGGGSSEKVYRSMMLGEYAKQISANGGLGIADQVYREILAVQEGSSR
jgi:flagellar protein FlgJ